jgi:hypothetical protein
MVCDLVWDPPKQPVNVKRMIIYSFIPILSIYAGWRIQKFWVLLGINLLVGYGVGLPLEMVLSYPYGFVVSIAIQIPITVFVVRHFARKYNEKISQPPS